MSLFRTDGCDIFYGGEIFRRVVSFVRRFKVKDETARLTKLARRGKQLQFCYFQSEGELRVEDGPIVYFREDLVTEWDSIFRRRYLERMEYICIRASLKLIAYKYQ